MLSQQGQCHTELGTTTFQEMRRSFEVQLAMDFAGSDIRRLRLRIKQLDAVEYGSPEGTALVVSWNLVTRAENQSRTQSLDQRIDLALGKTSAH